MGSTNSQPEDDSTAAVNARSEASPVVEQQDNITSERGERRSEQNYSSLHASTPNLLNDRTIAALYREALDKKKVECDAILRFRLGNVQSYAACAYNNCREQNGTKTKSIIGSGSGARENFADDEINISPVLGTAKASTDTDKAHRRDEDSNTMTESEDDQTSITVDLRSKNPIYVSPIERRRIMAALREERLTKNYSSSYPTPILFNDLHDRTVYHRVIDKKQFKCDAILGFGLANFMSYAAHFCKYEARNGAEIVSVGSGNGAIESEIIATYRKHFADEIKITLVDPNPAHKVHFKTVDHLLTQRPNIVGNCVLLIIWPEPLMRNDGRYDIDAVRKLQPLAALTMYEPTGRSGSLEFTELLDRETKEDVMGSDWFDGKQNFGLGNYAVEKEASQEVYFNADDKFQRDYNFSTKPATRVYSLRMLKLKRLD